MINLTTSQQTAFEALKAFANGRTSNALAVLEGFAGTGKTTIVGELLNALQGLRVAVMAPTNKAVAVLREKTGSAQGVEFGSLHSFLGLRLKENEDGSQSCLAEGACSLHEYDLAVVDEASMVSENLFESILRFKRGCKILFVGDPAQLPPVADGGLDSPVFRMVPYKLRLNEIVRQAEGNPIIAASIVVRNAIEAGERVQASKIVAAFPLPPSSAGTMSGGIETMVQTLCHEASSNRQCRAIVWRNQTAKAINTQTHYRLFPECESPFAVGELVIANSEFKSDREAGYPSARIFNSEELEVAAIGKCAQHPTYKTIPAWRVVLKRTNGGNNVVAYYPQNESAVKKQVDKLWESYRVAKQAKDRSSSEHSAAAWALTRAFAPLRHCYAMTAHKSQGSTFDTALVYWDDLMGQRNDFEFNRMLYVSMTRASKYMALVTQ